MSTPENFTRRLRNLEAMWYRLDRGQLTGRNCESSDRTRENTYRELRDAIRADANTDAAPLCAWLDANPKIAARWDRIERRTVGLPV